MGAETPMPSFPLDGIPASLPPVSSERAEQTFALAARRLDALRWAAILGGEYDPDVYDHAVVEYRYARVGLVIARLAAHPRGPRFALAA